MIREIVVKGKGLFDQYKVYFKNSFVYLFSSLFSAVIGIGLNPFFAKNLSPTDYAIIGYFSSFNLIILPILNFSLISYYLRNYFKIPDNKKQLVSDTILIALLIYGFIALVISCIVFSLYCKWSKVSFPFYPYALLTFAPVYLSNFQSLYLVKCRLNREALKYSRIILGGAILIALLSILFVVIYKYGAVGRLSAMLLGVAITGIYCFKKLFVKFQFDFDIIKDAFRFGWPLSVSAILWYFLSGVDRAMLVKLNDNYNLGLYSVGLQLAGYLLIFHTTIALTFDPDIYKAIAENKRRKLVKIISAIFTFNAIPNIIFIIFAPFIIGILTYHRYTAAAHYAQILTLKNIAISFYFVLINIVVGYGYTKAELIITIMGSLISLGMFRLLINNYGFYGAAWGQVLSFVVMSLLAGFFLLYKFRFKKLENQI